MAAHFDTDVEVACRLDCYRVRDKGPLKGPVKESVYFGMHNERFDCVPRIAGDLWI